MSLLAPAGNCPACTEQREHTVEEWLLYHPFHLRPAPPVPEEIREVN
jgi:hypothetical protein